ncbi:hypothetical protein B0H14DRAFT_2384262 [Mycena olivaceomarginata]|nr:hypothetical protein B0H14DRAFT_2384262 [Mycena olivaceomarginata]
MHIFITEDLKAGWKSGVYQFFSDNVKEHTNDGGCKYQFFTCAVPNGCKHKKNGLVRYQTNTDGLKATDRSSTSNLRKHAVKCWGKAVVEVRLSGTGDGHSRDGSIFAVFARAEQHPVQVTDRVHTEPELCAHVARWVAESNRPLNIVADRELKEILCAGRPEVRVPSRRVLGCDLNTAYEQSRGYIEHLLREYPGWLSFSTDAWTSPNHRAFVAWTVHLQHEGELLGFPIDIFEVPEVRPTLIFPYKY